MGDGVPEEEGGDAVPAVAAGDVDADFGGDVVAGAALEGLEAEPAGDVASGDGDPDGAAVVAVGAEPGQAAVYGLGSVSAVDWPVAMAAL